MAPSIAEAPVEPGIKCIDTSSKRGVGDFVHGKVDVDTVVRALIQDGGCIIRNVATTVEVARMHEETTPWFDKSVTWGGKFYPKETKRVYGLAGKSATCAQVMIGNQLFQDVADRFLTRSFTYWMGDEKETSVSKPQLTSAVGLSIAQGAPSQPLHRDDMMYHNAFKATSVEDYDVSRETGVLYFVAGTKTTVANGATRFAPGSHRGNQLDAPDESQCVYAELEVGDGFIMLPSCYHGGSANTTPHDRILFNFFMTTGLLRQVSRHAEYLPPCLVAGLTIPGGESIPRP